MKITLRGQSVVYPAEPTPQTTFWLSLLDKLHPQKYFVCSCYFYRSNGADDFFDQKVLKDALARALVPFYPWAGRLRLDSQDRVEEIECNGEGVLFVEAEADAMMDDLGYVDNPIPADILCPVVDFSQGLSACPLLLVQVTRFKCGGVSLGTTTDHHLADGASALHFFNTWSDIARGLGVLIPPFLDKHAVLSARNPPQPKFPHLEYQPPPKLKITQPEDSTLIHKRLELTQDQLSALKEKCKEEEENSRYSSFEVLVGHAWRSVSMAYQLPDDQATKLRIVVDGRPRLQPPLPKGFLGNVVFHACHQTLAGELYWNPLKATVRKVREAIARMDDEYLRSAIDYLELQPDFRIPLANIYDYKCPNLAVVSWTRLPFYDTDFGWGEPVHMGRPGNPPLGRSTVIRTNDGSVIYSTTLPKEVMDRFEKLFYDI